MKKELSLEFKIEKSDISRIAVGEFTTIGARSYQEDSYDLCAFKAGSGEQCFCVVLSDGMGGLSNGDKVSNYTVSAYMNRISRFSDNEKIHHKLTEITNAVNDEVVSEGYGGGATAVALYCCRKGIFFCSTGDSRLYLFRNKALTQLTEDFDVMNRELERVIDGQITFSEADNNPERDNLAEFIGTSRQLTPDVNIKPLIPMKGDKLLVCSDGVYNTLCEKELIYCLSADAKTAALIMEKCINDKEIPAQDNATAVILEFI